MIICVFYSIIITQGENYYANKTKRNYAVNVSSLFLQTISKELEIEPTEAFVNIILADVEAYAKENFDKSVRKALTIPAWLNNAASETGTLISSLDNSIYTFNYLIYDYLIFTCPVWFIIYIFLLL